MIRLFDVTNNVVTPSEHCYTMKHLKQVMLDYPETYMDVYAYVFYMTCPNPLLNPFFDTPESEKEEIILSQLKSSVDSEDMTVINAIDICKKLYETPTFRAYMGIKHMLDALAEYMETTTISHGRDGNITALVNAAAKFDQIRLAFKGAYKDLMEEQQSQARGGTLLGYDQTSM